MITDPEDYFAKGCGRCARFDTAGCSTRKWADGLALLRALCLEAGLTEEAKWGHPCYSLSGRNIVLLGAFRTDFRMTFMNSALMKDPEGALQRPGPNSQHASLIRFTAAAEVSGRTSVIRHYLQEAVGYAAAGVKPPRAPRSVDLPDELTEALDTDPDLAEAFHDLTPGRQRSYVINLASAKKSETRVARIAKFRDHILAGKGAQER